MKKIILLALAMLMVMNVSATVDDYVARYTFDGPNQVQQYFGDIEGTEGILDGALIFDGTDDSIFNEEVHASQEFTWNVWTHVAGNPTGVNIIMGNSAYTDGGCYFARTTNNMIDFQCELDGGSSAEAFNNNLTIGDSWAMFTVIYNNRNVLLYSNGILVNNETFAGDINYDDSVGMYIGRRNWTGSHQNYNGKLDELIMINRTLTGQEILDLYQSGSPTQKAIEIINDSVLYYSSMDELYDESGNGNNGKEYGNMKSSTDVKNENFVSSMEFDGSNDYITISDDSVFDISNAITLSAWVKSTSTGINSVVISKDHPGGYGLFANSGMGTAGYMYIYDGDDNACHASTLTVIDETWHHIVGTYDRENITFFVDGVFDNSQANTGAINLNNLDLTIGMRSSTKNTNPFSGLIDEVRVYNRVLTDNEVLELYRGPNNNATYSNPTPADEAINVKKFQDLSLDVYDLDQDNITVNFYFEDELTCTKETSYDATATCDIGLMNYNSSYSWNATITDGINTVYTPTYEFTTEEEMDFIATFKGNAKVTENLVVDGNLEINGCILYDCASGSCKTLGNCI